MNFTLDFDGKICLNLLTEEKSKRKSGVNETTMLHIKAKPAGIRWKKASFFLLFFYTASHLSGRLAVWGASCLVSGWERKDVERSHGKEENITARLGSIPQEDLLNIKCTSTHTSISGSPSHSCNALSICPTSPLPKIAHCCQVW